MINMWIWLCVKRDWEHTLTRTKQTSCFWKHWNKKCVCFFNYTFVAVYIYMFACFSLIWTLVSDMKWTVWPFAPEIGLVHSSCEWLPRRPSEVMWRVTSCGGKVTALAKESWVMSRFTRVGSKVNVQRSWCDVMTQHHHYQ